MCDTGSKTIQDFYVILRFLGIGEGGAREYFERQMYLYLYFVCVLHTKLGFYAIPSVSLLNEPSFLSPVSGSAGTVSK